MFAKDSRGTRWLYKSYGGNHDRIATELLSNAVYRDMGAHVPTAGLHEHGGKTALAYKTLDGQMTYKGPSRRVGAHFMTDALLGNRDVLGLENDNILWGKDGPIRLDQGGTLEFRAMGEPKEFGPVPTEVESLMAKPSRQGTRSSKVTLGGLREQAAAIHAQLTPARVDALVNQAPFKDTAMRERVRANLKHRVAWMGRFARGLETVSIPGLQEEVSLAEFDLGALREGSTIQHLWDEALHPRNQHGEFIDKLGDLKKGDSVKLDSKTTIKRDGDGTLRVVRSGGIIKGFTHPADAARAALDRSAKSKDADSVGGTTSHKDFNAYMAAHPKVLGTALTQNLGAGPVTSFGGTYLGVDQATAELSKLRGRLDSLKQLAPHDKYVARAVPTLAAREKELTAKVKALGGDHNIAAVHVEHHHVTPPSSTPQIDAVLGALPPTAKAHLASQGTLTPGALLQQHHPTTGVLVRQVKVTTVHPSGAVTVKALNGQMAGTSYTIESKDVAATLKPQGWGAPSSPGTPFSQAKIGDVVHNPKTSYQGTIVKASPQGAEWQLKSDGNGSLAYAPKSSANMVVGPHPNPQGLPGVKTHEHGLKPGDHFKANLSTYKIDASDATHLTLHNVQSGQSMKLEHEGAAVAIKSGAYVKVPDPAAKAVGKVAGKQANLKDAQGFTTPLSKLDLAPGDKIQMKKGGHIYTLKAPYGPAGGWSTTGPNGSKVFSGSRRPAFVHKADKTPLKLAGSTMPMPGGTQDLHPFPKVGDQFFHGSSTTQPYTVASVGADGQWTQVTHPDTSGMIAVSVSSLRNKSIYPKHVSAKAHAEHVADLKAALDQLGPNGTELSKLGNGVVFTTPTGKLLYRDKQGTIKNLETGAHQGVLTSAVPPKTSNLSAHVKAAEALLARLASLPSKPSKPAAPDDSWASFPKEGSAEGKLLALQGGSGASKVPASSRSAISYYTGSGYVPMNSQLRTPRKLGSVSTAKEIARMDQAMGAAPGLPEDFVMWRGVTGKTANEYKQAQPGQSIGDAGFISTTTSEKFAHGWGDGLVMKIRMPKGTKGVFVGQGTGLSGHLTEKELILQRGVEFEVIARREEKGSVVLIVQPVTGHL